MVQSVIFLLCLCPCFSLHAQDKPSGYYRSPGVFSLGTRNTASFFEDANGAGIGIGGQFRLQATERLGTEWFFDYIPSKHGSITFRNDYHIGWSVLFYPGKKKEQERFLQSYVIAGHCFDYTWVAELANPNNHSSRWSMATQAGAGSHLNFTSRLDGSLSAQYMLHFGKAIRVQEKSNGVSIQKENSSSPDGHFLLTFSINYKMGRLWKSGRS